MLEFILTHDGKNWIARRETITIEAPSLEKLDIELQKTLRKKCCLKEHREKKVLMTFDNATIPHWIRQYMPHYFNRIVDLVNKGSMITSG